jgi:hypothetical protein
MFYVSFAVEELQVVNMTNTIWKKTQFGIYAVIPVHNTGKAMTKRILVPKALTGIAGKDSLKGNRSDLLGETKKQGVSRESSPAHCQGPKCYRIRIPATACRGMR